MASGIPVIAADWGGPADYISPDTGILIPPTTPDQFVDELRKAMLSLANNPDMRANLGQAGRRRVAALYDWDVKAKRLLELYQSVVKDSI